jgi:hypothetical protein
MAAPLMAQSDDVSVKTALDLLQQSQTQAAAGNLEAAAELAATAQALLRGGAGEAASGHTIHGEWLHGVPEGSQVIIDANGNVSVGEGGEMRIIQIESGSEEGDLQEVAELQDIFELHAIVETDCTDEICDGSEGCESAGDAECEIECEVQCEEDGSIEILMDRLGKRSRFPGPGPHAMQGGMPHAPHGMQGVGDVHMQLQAVQLELQALRLELQALRMQMGAMRGGMGNHMGGSNMGGHMGRRRAPQVQSFGDLENVIMLELQDADTPNMMFFGKGGDIQNLRSLEDVEYFVDSDHVLTEIEEDYTDGIQVHSEIKLIHNGKTYEGEAARKMMKELGLGEAGARMQLRVGPTPPTPPLPPAPRIRVRKVQDQEDL